MVCSRFGADCPLTPFIFPYLKRENLSGKRAVSHCYGIVLVSESTAPVAAFMISYSESDICRQETRQGNHPKENQLSGKQTVSDFYWIVLVLELTAPCAEFLVAGLRD